jgi:hypothetical protein
MQGRVWKDGLDVPESERGRDTRVGRRDGYPGEWRLGQNEKGVRNQLNSHARMQKRGDFLFHV